MGFNVGCMALYVGNGFNWIIGVVIFVKVWIVIDMFIVEYEMIR